MSLFNLEEIPPGQPRSQVFKIQLHGHEVPVRLLEERRPSSRVSISGGVITIKLSAWLSKTQKQEQVQSFMDWVKEKTVKRPELLKPKPSFRLYEEGSKIKQYNEEFLIHIQASKTEFAEVKVRSGELILLFPEQGTPRQKQRMASKLVARIMAIHFKEKVSNRLKELNDLHFQKPLHRVTLKNNVSNWGSCSTKGNVNISTRLLFAPEMVIDYVFIHELAHLVHHDHSDRFWKLVEEKMPDYMQAEKWLKKHSEDCYF